MDSQGRHAGNQPKPACQISQEVLAEKQAHSPKDGAKVTARWAGIRLGGSAGQRQDMVGWRRIRTERDNIMSRFAAPKRSGCRRCPFRASSGRCLRPGLKSGRCGDWVWYMRDGKQWRRLYVTPRDPRTPRQMHCREGFGAASRNDSHSLTDEQRTACIAAGAKLWSRRRLGQRGRLTGQQYSIRREWASKT